MNKISEETKEYVRQNYRTKSNTELKNEAGITMNNLVYVFRLCNISRTKDELLAIRRKHAKLKKYTDATPHWEKRKYEPFDFI